MLKFVSNTKFLWKPVLWQKNVKRSKFKFAYSFYNFVTNWISITNLVFKTNSNNIAHQKNQRFNHFVKRKGTIKVTKPILKVSKSRKQISKFSFEPKNERKYFCISALASRKRSNQKNKGMILF